MLCGTSSNENAIKAAFIWYQYNKRGKKPPTDKDLKSCMKQELPGTPNLTVLSFQGAFHGRSLGLFSFLIIFYYAIDDSLVLIFLILFLAALSLTRSKSIHKVDIPAFNWPVANFPRYKYPLAKNIQYNERQDDECLAMVYFAHIYLEKIFHQIFLRLFFSKQNAIFCLK